MRSFSFAILALAAVSGVVAKLEVKRVAHDLDHATNAERFKRGLPPLPPRKIRSPTGTSDAIAPRSSPGMTCTTTQTISGRLEVTNKNSGALYGYVTTDYMTGYSTVDMSQNFRTVSITLPCAPLASDLSGLNMASGTNDYPYFGPIMSYYSTNNDLSTTNDNFAWMGTTDLTGKSPTVTGNSLEDAQGAEQASESPTWTYDPTTGNLALNWYNTNGAPATTIPVLVGSDLYATGNVALFAVRFNRPDVYQIKYRLVDTTIVFH